MDILVGAPARPVVSSTEQETEASRLDRARAVFEGMQQQYASGNFARYGELLQQLEKLLTSP
jgi:predicted lipid-binding transport protein (Tim44 family)